MSDERKPKPKRGYDAHRILAHTPLTVSECIDRLRSAHFPIRSLDVRVQVDDRQVTVELLTKNTFGKIYRRGTQDQISTWWWPEGVWFEGTLTASDNDLTRIEGAIRQRLSLSYLGLVLQVVLLVLFASAILLTVNAMHRPDKTLIAWALFWGTITGGAIVLFAINKRRARRLTSVLQSWLSDRLNI